MGDTYYTKHDAGGGGVGSFADPFTFQEAADAALADDLVLVCNTGVYTPAATIDFDTNTGAILTPITFRGANADGSDDGTVATISGSGMGSGNLFYLNINNMLNFDNLRITASKGAGIRIGNIVVYLTLSNCRIDNSVGDGIYETSASINVFLFGCEIDNNARGLMGNVASRGRWKVCRCSIHDNSSYGIFEGSTIIAEDNLIYDNGDDGINLEVANGAYQMIRGNVFFGNSADGIAIKVSLGRLIIENNIFRSNGGYAINTNTGTIRQFMSCKNNCSHNNTSGHIDINGGTLPGTGHVLADPLFVSETDGSENFSLQSGSPCLAAAIDAGIWTVGGGTSYRDIGAVQRQAGAGAGGLLMANKRGNKQ